MNSALIKAIVLFCLIIGSVFVIATRFNLSTDLGLFLPDPETRFDRLLSHQLSNGASTNIVLLAFSGLSDEELAELNHQVASELESSGLFRRVSNNISELGDEALAFLEEHRYLLSHSDLSAKFTPEGFKQSLARRLEGLASTSAPMEKKYLRQDPSGEVLSLLEEWQGKISRHKRPLERHGVWFSEDLARSLILLEIKADVSEM